ncbi:MAG: bifunctional tetrahydrofolate synthase/dihydrofolate synthase [Burkholderiaceae bacterium]|nr:bifunctional tetrahydrofolate synthase/dihydrofolate synthase [Burkholderiaceae bacterium]
MEMKTLKEWLEHVESLHAKSIDLGLERMQKMLKVMNIHFDCPVILVGGTNGKGSTCNCLEQILLSAGYQVGVHTSPHLIHFNERVRVNGVMASDEELLPHFSKVEECRDETTLSYFEFTLLAILDLFYSKHLDVLILEIGLGGRLDAVNTLEPTASIVTTVDIDHTGFLGNTRDAIGWEKAHIYRPGKVAICADEQPPETLVQYANKIQAKTVFSGRDYHYQIDAENSKWTFVLGEKVFADLPMPALPGEHQIRNVSGALAVLLSIQNELPVQRKDIENGLMSMHVTGRFERVSQNPEIILDVGHNPHAARALKKALNESVCKGKTYAIFGMLADKDRSSVCEIMKDSIDEWVLLDLDGPRGGKAEDLESFLVHFGVQASKIQKCISMIQALETIQYKMKPTDRIIVFGSFLTVSSAIEALHLTIK